MCIVCTSRVGYLGGLDITVKSAVGSGRVLAPTWALVGGVKGWQGYETLTPAAYTARYYNLLRDRYRQDEQPFLDLLRRECLVLTCYCSANPAVFCHRHLAVDILEKIATAKELPFSRGGELVYR